MIIVSLVLSLLNVEVRAVAVRQPTYVRAHSDPIHGANSPSPHFDPLNASQQFIAGQLAGMISEPPIEGSGSGTGFNTSASSASSRILSNSSGARASAAPSQGSVQMESDFVLGPSSADITATQGLPLWPAYGMGAVPVPFIDTRHQLQGQLQLLTAAAAHRRVAPHQQSTSSYVGGGGGVFVDEHTPPDNIWQLPSDAPGYETSYYPSSDSLGSAHHRLVDRDDFRLQQPLVSGFAFAQPKPGGCRTRQRASSQTKQVAALVAHTANLNVGGGANLLGGDPSRSIPTGLLGSAAILNPATLGGVDFVPPFGRHHHHSAAAAALSFSLALGGSILSDPRSQQSRGEESPLVGAYMHSSPVFSH